MYKFDIYKHDSTSSAVQLVDALCESSAHMATDCAVRTEALRMCSAHAQSVSRVRTAGRAAEEWTRRQDTLDSGVRVSHTPPSLLVLEKKQDEIDKCLKFHENHKICIILWGTPLHQHPNSACGLVIVFPPFPSIHRRRCT